MAYAHRLDTRPFSHLSVDRKPQAPFFDDNDTLDDSILDSSIMSPTSESRDDSFSNAAGLFSPDSNMWEEPFPTFVDSRSTSNNPFFEQSNNPFTRLDATQAATYGQQPAAWPLPDAKPASQPFGAFTQEFQSAPPSAFMPVPSTPATAFHGLSVETNVRPSSVFPPAPAEQTPRPMSPHSNKEWMAMAQQEVEQRPIPKRMRPNTPPRFSSPFPRRDGIRKKNARFEIPAERSLLNIDQLIAQATNEDEIKELKQQKRLLRNRQAALDSRQRKKKHTEELEEEKKMWTERYAQLEEEMGNLRLQIDAMHHEKEQLHRQSMEAQQIIETMQWEKEELVRNHTIETGELRKKVTILTEKLETTATAMSHQPSQSSFADFANEMDNLNMGPSDWDSYIFVNDFVMDSEPANQATPQPSHDTSLVVASKKKEPAAAEQKEPIASGLLLMLLLCGAFVASKSSGSTPPAIPRMPEEVRAASTQVLDSLLKDSGAAPTSTHGVIANRAEGLEPAPSGSIWQKNTLSGTEFASLSHPASGLDQLHSSLTAPTKEQEVEQAFSITPSQYNSLTSADFTRRVYSIGSDEMSTDALSPGSQPSSHRRNLAEALQAMRQDGDDSVAEVYTRSLLWDRIPTEVVQEFKRIVEESNAASAKADCPDGKAGQVEVSS